ncbi:MAG TPA: hypothetical protein VG815_16185 [Chloroflexota bacterium]|nr:hypothetical protein [Chloroflexota bacterium]
MGNFMADVKMDLQYNHGALMAGVDGSGLTGWQSAGLTTSVSHYIRIQGWNPGSGEIAYTDTYAGAFGTFDERIDSFYNTALMSLNKGSTGHYVSDKVVLF